MNQMTKRNKGVAQMNSQMQTMQKVMPLIFAYIYFLIPSGVVVYMIVSSAIRIGTQDFIFRHGIVQKPGEREISGTTKVKKPGGSPAVGKAGGTAALAAGDAPRATGPKTGNRPPGKTPPKPSAGGGTRGGTRPRPAGSGGTNGKSSGNGNTNGVTDAKSHPRSKSKRTRKAR